jgi:hypothetical protein
MERVHNDWRWEKGNAPMTRMPTTAMKPLPLPTPDAYWVLPGRLLAGEYPGHPNEAQAIHKLGRFQEAGVTLFFDLTEAGEHGLRPYAPLLGEIFAPLGLSVKHRRFPIPDMDTPDASQMRGIQESLAGNLAQGETVYVHCFGGIGRTGTVIGCFLVEQGKQGDEALAKIAAWRQGTPDGWKQSPETEAQRQMVRDWVTG